MTFRTRILSAAGGLFFLTIFISSFANTWGIYDSAWKMITALVATVVVTLLVIHWATTRLSRKMFLIVFLLLGLACRVAWIIWNPASPESDFLFMYTAAQEAASGNFAFSDSAYYISFPYQLGFTMYEAAVIKLFGNHLIIFKLLNALFSIGTAVALYLSASKVFHESCGRIAAMVYLFYIPNIIMCSVLTNQHLSVFLFLLGSLLLLRGKDSVSYWLLAGLAIGLGHLIRPVGIVYLAGVVLFVLLIIGQQWRGPIKRQAAVTAGKLGAVIVMYYLVQLLASTTLISSGVTQHSLFDGDKYWKFMVGLNAEKNGSWNLEDANYTKQYAFGEERHKAELSKIKERLENKSELTALLGRKLVTMWGSPDSSPYWSLRGLDKWELEQKLNQWEGPMYALMCAFGVVSMIALWRTGNDGGEVLLYLFLLLLYVGAHLLVENQPRYRLDFVPVLILLQSYGAYQIGSWMQGRRSATLDKSWKGERGVGI
ncbi:Dolichyl-phosphate-mannose-protein mannosyltransferase [Paenibacillus catalpae]|uniref:Dolichyl-phosphate-mannose-protein mannosyltransferase n=1 Tax=Paenibacillus catalpae TaxID=1045775 RepID=A0A1I1YG07_9BACL|nr:glycosyltransferase family 39 protein [Paenibacillus catalpae]SFE18524.1 Dolichyl-phosphate-mannose-protein mannosyltransferase [Paenibacillus catalpae]